MIGKIIKGRSFKGCVSYVLADKEATILASEGVLETDMASITNSVYMQSLMNPNLSECVGHIPLAFSPEDSPRMTNQFMEQLAKEYMKGMGIVNTQYIRLLRKIVLEKYLSLHYVLQGYRKLKFGTFQTFNRRKAGGV